MRYYILYFIHIIILNIYLYIYINCWRREGGPRPVLTVDDFEILSSVVDDKSRALVTISLLRHCDNGQVILYRFAIIHIYYMSFQFKK